MYKIITTCFISKNISREV